MSLNHIFIGIGSSVLALRAADGQEVWRQKLATFGSSGITGVAMLGDRLYASCSGELTCLDPATGHIFWTNPLKGLGTGFITIAGEDPSGAAAASVAAASAATAVMISTSASTS